MKILVTGGAGFIGSHVADAALSRGHEVAVLDNLSTGRLENVPTEARFFEADIRNRDATFRVLREFGPDVVSHQAAQASIPFSVRHPADDIETNVLGSIHVLDASVELGVARLVFASTGGAIYGEVSEGCAQENDPARPSSPYAISKLAVEQLLDVYREHRNLQSYVLRYANVYGPRQDPRGEAGVVSIFIGRALRGEPLGVFARRTIGDAGCERDYVFVADVARLNLLALEGVLNERVINVGTGVPTQTKELARQVIHAVGSSSSIEHGPRRAGDLERSVLDSTRCLRALGRLQPLTEGLDVTVRWFRN